MNYITHHRFRANAICGEVNLRYGTRLIREGGMLCLTDGRAICFASSQNAKEHFARDDDGQGLERGRLTHAIAFAPRKSEQGYRFSEAEREMLAQDYRHWLRQDTDMILFNDDFFAAPVNELRELAKRLKIKA